MRLLIVHQNAPAQYKHLIGKLVAEGGHEIVVISQENGRPIPGVRRVYYRPDPAPATLPHRYLLTTEEALRYGLAVLEAARTIKAEGFTPDVMLGHNAWGETLFLKDVWLDVPLLGYFEFFYHARGADTGFDPEFSKSADDFPRTRMMNTVNLLGLNAADWGHSATFWQRNRYPEMYRPRISVVHEGIDTTQVRPNPSRVLALPGDKGVLRHGDEVITYVSRSLEPYRGFHSFMRALPEILRRRPNARILVVGKDDVSYGPRLAGKTFREALLAEQGGRIDLERVHFLGWVPYEVHLAILQVSAVHVYLTYPFVLSWSMLEAMAAGCAVVGSATPPVMEVIRHGDNGLLVDFFSPREIADRVDEVLSHPDRMAPMRERARRTVLQRYDLETVCLPKLRGLIELLANRKRPQSDATPAEFGAAVTVERALTLACEAERDGNMAEAERILRAVVAQRATRHDLLHRMGTLLARLGRYEEAVEFFERGLRLVPGNGELRHGLADCLDALGRPTEASALRQPVM